MVILLSLFFLLAIAAAKETRMTDDYKLNIDQGVLKAINQLQTTDKLDLSNRGIKEIDDGVFKNVNVKILNLESNEISSLESRTFSGIGTDLEELNLGSNQIRIIDSSFVGLKNLKLLNFSNNPVGYLGPGEFAGVPHNADIIVKGNRLHTLNTRVFEEPDAHPFQNESYIHRVTRDVEDFDDSWAELTEKAQIFLAADKFIDPGQTASFDYRTVVCMDDSILTKVGILMEGETLSANCIDSDIFESGSQYLNLQNRGIQGVAAEWYQLQQSPIAFIDLSSNNLTELSPELLNDLPEAVKVVDLSDNLISQIKKDAFSNFHLRAVSFRANLIEDVEDGSFGSSNLWGLYFTGNQISDISFSASLPASLNLLFLNKNQILRIPDRVFSGLQNLTYLDLGRNGITTIQANAFEGLTSLNAIDLAHNQISKLEAGAFLGLRNLDRISLNGNSISSCEDGVFEGLETLTTLDLSLNNFTQIGKENFGRLPATLLFLDLDDNEIIDIERGCFVNVPQRSLKLSSNKLSKILPTQFEINALEEFYIEDNLIAEISQQSFERLRAVRYISLAGNQVSEIPRGTLKHLNALTTFDISRNPITELKNGALYGIRKTSDSKVVLDENKLELIQGGIFENV